MRNKSDFHDHLLSFTWLLYFIIPTNIILYVFVPISVVVLFNNKLAIPAYLKYSILGLIVSLIFTLLINFQAGYVLKNDIFRALVLILLFFSFSRYRGIVIRKEYIVFAAVYLIFTQFIFFLNISFFVNFFQQVYPYEGNRDMYGYYERFTLNEFGLTRLGGIYYNPNQYARYIQIILITLLCEIKQFRKIELQVLVPLIVFSIAATGSRTSFLVLIVIGLSYFYFNNKFTAKNVFLIGIVGVGILFYIFSNTNIGEFRMLKVDEGLDNSLGAKVNLFYSYHENNQSALAFLFGNLSSMVMVSSSGFTGTDFDIGNIPIFYGYVFFLFFIQLCVLVYRKTRPMYRVIYPILLWMFSSSIICNYRTVPIFLLILGLYYRRSLIEKNNEIKIKEIVS